MATSRKRTLLFVAVPLLILMLPLSIYWVDSAAASDKVARNVTIAGVDVGRTTESEAVAAVDEYAAYLTSLPATISVNGTEFILDPAEVGLTVDSEQAVADAMTRQKDGISEWIRAFSESVDVPVTATIDPEMLEIKLVEWEQEAIPNPAFNGSIEIVNGAVQIEYPRDGEAIDREQALTLVTAALEVGSQEVVSLPTATSVPVLTVADLDAAQEEAERIMATDVSLTQDDYGFELTVSSTNIARSLSAEVVSGPEPTIEFAFNHAIFLPIIGLERQNLELEPQDAYWETVVVDDFEDWDENYEITDSEQDDPGLPANDTITLIPHKDGTSIDAASIAQAIEGAARADGSGELPIVLGSEPDFTTAMAEAYGELYEVSEFTTYKPGVNRAHNINLMADTIDNTIVWPGDTFSVNDIIGRRTLDKGYKYDCAIVSGELSCEEEPVNVGGGVSQFGTTIFNAIYFGCYEDVTHKPHSIYFSKYPEGREATLGYPSPDVAFKNDSGAPVIIRTSYTNRSITVTFFGNQEGMTCDTERSGRTNQSSARTVYQADPDGVVAPGQEVTKSKGSGGWNVTNTRIFYDANGNEIKREDFPWRYSGEKNVILVHPCDPRGGGNGVCPVKVPGLAGSAQGAAEAALAELGLGSAVTVEGVTDPAQDGVVISVSPTGWQDPGTVINHIVGSYTEPEPPPDEGGGGEDG